MEYDQNSIAGLMNALATHGPNTVLEEEENEEEEVEGHQHYGGGGGEGNREPRVQRRETTTLPLSQQTSMLIHEVRVVNLKN